MTAGTLRIFTAFLLLFASFGIRAQQEYTLYFVRDLPQAAWSNPAFRSIHKNSIMLPSLMYNYGNNAFAYNELIRQMPDGDSIYIDGDGVIANMADKNRIQLQAQIDILGASFTVKQWYFTLLISEKADVAFSYPKELFQLLWKGNAQFIGREVELGPAVNANIFKEYSLGINRRFEKLDVGIRLKLLSGIANVYTRKNSLRLTTTEDNYSTRLVSDYEIQTSGIEDIGDRTSPFSGIVNPGMGIDIGGNYRFNEKISVAASLIDLGQIKWKHDVVTRTSNGDFIYTGVDINDFLDSGKVEFDDYTDSIKNLYFQEEKGGSYYSYLIPKAYISGTWNPNQHTTIGALLNLQFFDGVKAGFSLYAGRRFFDALDAGISYSIKNRRYANFGLNLGVGPKAFRIFVATDNLVTMFAMRKGRNVTVRYGININFGGDKKEKKKVENAE